MGVVQSKKDGIVRKFELKMDLQAPIRSELLQLTAWSFPDIKQLYDSYGRKTDCPYIDFFTFHKILPFTTEVSRCIFQAYAQGDKFVCIFELVVMLILLSHNNYRKKLQCKDEVLYVIFDFTHTDSLRNRQLILIFECFVRGYCRFTAQILPSYEYLSRYTIERFVRNNSLEAMEKIVNYRRLIEEIQGNTDAFEMFRRFDQEIYGFFTQESYLFRVNQYKKYTRYDVDKLYQIIRKVNKENNYEDAQLVEKNRRFRLENRKVDCIHQLLEEKEEKFQVNRHRSSTQNLSSSLPTVKKGSLTKISTARDKLTSTSKFKTLQESIPKMAPNLISMSASLTASPSPTKSKKPSNSKKVLILNGKITNKQDIFEIIKYFKTLSNNKSEIKVKEFVKSFQKKAFLKKQVISLFKHFDLQKRGEVSFQDFLGVYYHNITSADIEVIKEWYFEYKQLHEADHFDLQEFNKKKDKKNHIELPKLTLKRIDQIFNSIDCGKKGYISMEDLKKAYNTGFTIKELEDMMKEFGQNNKIYKDGFIRMTLPEEWTIQGTDFVGQ